MLERVVPSLQQAQNVGVVLISTTESILKCIVKYPKLSLIYGLSLVSTALTQVEAHTFGEGAFDLPRFREGSQHGVSLNSSANVLLPAAYAISAGLVAGTLGMAAYEKIQEKCFKRKSFFPTREIKSVAELEAKKLREEKRAQFKAQTKQSTSNINFYLVQPREIKNVKAPVGKLSASHSIQSGNNREKAHRKLVAKRQREEAQVRKKAIAAEHRAQAMQLFLQEQESKKLTAQKEQQAMQAKKQAARVEFKNYEENLGQLTKEEKELQELRQLDFYDFLTQTHSMHQFYDDIEEPRKKKIFKKPNELECLNQISKLLPFLNDLAQEATDDFFDEQQLKYANCLRYSALLFVMPRLYLAVSHYMDHQGLSMKAERARFRYMLSHGMMELDVGTIYQATEKLQKILPVLLQLKTLTDFPLYNELQQIFDNLISNNFSKEEKNREFQEQKEDMKYYDWVANKIVPIINAFSKNLTEIYSRYAIIKLFSFIGEYYNQSRRERFEKDLSGVSGITPQILSLLNTIHFSVRNRTEHLMPNFPDVISMDRLEKLCQAVKLINPKVSTFEEFDKQAIFSLRKHEKIIKLNPKAHSFFSSQLFEVSTSLDLVPLKKC